MFQRIFPAIFLFASILLARAQAPRNPLPPGPEQAKVKAACTSCHNATNLTKQHLTRRQWSDQLAKMESLGAVIPDSDRNSFLNYLTKNFGPKKAAAKDAAKTAAKKSGSAAD